METPEARRRLREISAKIEKASNQLRANNPQLTREQAVDRVLNLDPTLYAEWKRANSAIRALGGF